MLKYSHNISVFCVLLEKYDWSTSFFVKSLLTDWGLVLQNQYIREDPLKEKNTRQGLESGTALNTR